MELKHTDFPPPGVIDGVIMTLTSEATTDEAFNQAAGQAIALLELFRDTLRKAYVDSLDGSHKPDPNVL